MRVAGRIALLVVLWLLAWGDPRLGNIVSGAIVAAALLIAFPPAARHSVGVRLRPLALVRLAVHVGVQLVVSNIVMARLIVRRGEPAQPGVLAHRLQTPSDEVVTLMSSIIALSPGTMTVDVAPDSSTIYVHFFLLNDIDAARLQLAHLEQLVVDAIGAPPVVHDAQPAEGIR